MTLMRRPLFDIPSWVDQLDDVTPFHGEMAREVEDMIDADPLKASPNVLAHQTSSDPFLLPSRGWRLLDAHCAATFSRLAKENFQRWCDGEFHLRRWAIRYGKLDAEEKRRLASQAMHNHIPALFSAVYYLRLPPELSDRPEGGTVFVNPIANLMDMISPRTTTISPREGLLVVFPSFVDHAPVPVSWDAVDTPRIVVSCDVFFVSGKTGASGPGIVPARSAG